MTKIAFLFPGQGSQYVGMGEEFYNNYSSVRKLFNLASEIVSLDLKKLCFSGPEDILTSTQNVQPAMTVVNIACCEALRVNNIHPKVVAGHSLGEYSALYAAQVLDFHQVVKLVQIRGAVMQEAANKNPGAMAAIISLPISVIENICADCNVEVANINSPKQIIITGTSTGIEKAILACQRKGAKRCIKLNVSGPWHSHYMQLARNKLESAMEKELFSNPRIPVICNVDANYLTSGDEAKIKLSQQLYSPVLWLQSIKKLIKDGYKVFVEVGPKRVLSGLVRRISPDTITLNVQDISSLEKTLSFLKNLSS